MKTRSNQEHVHYASHDWTNNLWCKPLKQTSVFKSYRTDDHDLTCKSRNLVYLENANFNTLKKVRLPLTSAWKTTEKNAKSEKSVLVCKHFNETEHNFQANAEFTLIEQIKKQTTTEETKISWKNEETSVY